MSLNIVGIVGLPANYGGFETLVENLLSSDDNHKYSDITVYCSSKNYKYRPESINGIKLTYIPFKANGVQSIIYDMISLIHSLIKRPDTVLILGVSGCLFLPVFRVFSRSKIVTNIDGLEWKRSKWGAWTKKFLKLSERLAVRFSHEVVADNQAIADYIKSEYAVNSTVIAYGGEHAVVNNVVNTDADFALAICRIEPENNVEMILNAFSKTNKVLKFVGNWNKSEFGRRMKSEFSIFENIELVDPIYDIEKLSVLRSSCSYYIHGHSAGGTNPSLVEMMHYGKTIICYDCIYNRASTEEKATFFMDSSDLVVIIDSNNSNYENGEIMLEIAQRRYTWCIVRKQYFDLIE